MKKEHKYWVKLTWVLRWIIKVFDVAASRENVALAVSNFSHFPDVYIVIYTNHYIYKQIYSHFPVVYILENLALMKFECVFGFDREFNFNYQLLFKLFFTGLWII